MLEKLSTTLKKVTDKISNAIFLDRELVDSIVRDMQRALLEADVNVQLVLQITQKIKIAALDERIKGIEKKEHIIKLIHDELVQILGTTREVTLQKRNVFLLLGLYGSGKTTTVGKLASFYAKRGNKVCALGLDVYRPAASEQLKQVCDKLNIPTFIDPTEKDPKKIYKKFQKELKEYSLVIVDTAGRDSLNTELIEEIEAISALVEPTEVFLVLPADIGQTAKKQAETFKKAVLISGVIISRMDSTAKAGGALTACAEVHAPVIFIGTGEKSSDLETFNPEAFLSRLLGMGDLQGLMEKIHSSIDEQKLKKTQKRIEEGKFTLREFQTQLESMGEMGSMDKIMSMIPGLGKAAIPEDQLESQTQKMNHWKHATNSMTPEEIENPELFEKQTARIQRVAKGSGTTTSEIRALLKQYKMIKEMISSQAVTSGSLDQKTMMKFAKEYARKMRL